VKRSRLVVIRRLALVAGIVAGVWAVVVARGGGFAFSIGSVPIRSRNPINVAIVAMLCALTVWAISKYAAGGIPLREEWWWWKKLVQTACSFCWRQIGRLRPVPPALVVLVIGIALYGHQWLAARPLWLDEEMIALNIRDRKLLDLPGALWLGQSAPLGWLTIQRIVILIGGASELALRIVPTLFGMLTVAGAYWIGRRWLEPIAAAVLALLCTFSIYVFHYPFEVKHYSADVFWGLLLPGLAVWAVDHDQPADRARRALVWWVAAAVGHWFANGALFVTPACALVLLVLIWRRDGVKAATRFAYLGLIWLASFGLHYQLSIGHTHRSGFLRSYWANELPPESSGPASRFVWVANRIEPLAQNPGGTTMGMMLWISVVAGIVIARRRDLALAFALVPCSALLLGALGVIPLYERFTIWMAPALYVGIALVFDRALTMARSAIVERRWSVLIVAVLIVAAQAPLVFNIVSQGAGDVESRTPESKQQFDDRTAVRWLMRRARPGDAVVTTRLGWPAIWWYGELPIGDGMTSDQTPVDLAGYQVRHVPNPKDCQGDELADSVRNHQRVLVYLGFRDIPEGFDDVIVHRLAELGTVTAYREFTNVSRSAIIDLHATTDSDLTREVLSRTSPDGKPPVVGCIGTRPAVVW
jgi:hypothetical protein